MTRNARGLGTLPFSGLLLSGLLAITSSAQLQSNQKPATESEQQQSVKITTNEVLLDVIVLDKKGRPVRDLRPEQIEIYEDGVKQNVSKFVPVSNEQIATGKTSEAVAINAGEENPLNTNAPAHLNLVTLIIDHLTVQRVQPVRDAAFNFIDNSLTDDMLVRVMVVGRQLYVIEQFTNDRAKLRKAIEKAAGTVEKSHAEISKKIAGDLELIAAESSPLSSISESLYTLPSSEAQLAKLTLDTLKMSEKMSEEVKSNLHVFSLIPFARAHRQVPGRKMALYFSDGLYMPDGASEVLHTAISEANRANLSFYAVNIRNLVVGAGNQVSRLETSTVINQTRRPETSTFNSALADSFSVSDRYPGRTQMTTNFSTFEVLDRNKEMNKKGPLADLTEGTGGFLITNINDLNGALKRVGVELGNYYAISYSPAKQEYDGKFRTISVKLLRSGVKAKTRSGYFALPPSNNKRPVLTYETPLLAALNGSVIPHDFAFKAANLHFESNQNETHQAILLDLPLSNFIHEEDKSRKVYPVSFALMAIVKDEKGEIVHRFSEPHELEIPAASIESAKASSLTITRHFWLSPGRYLLEAVAHDQKANRISGQRRIFTVENPTNGLQTSSLFLIKQAEQINNDANVDDGNPLIVENKRIIPDLEETFSSETKNDLSFHLSIFPNAQVAEKPVMKLDLLQNDKLVATTTPDLPDTDAQGRINFTAGFPTSGLSPGKYQFHATVHQANQVAEESFDFTVNGEPRKEEAAADDKVITSSLTASDKVGELTLVALKTYKPIEASPTELLKEVEKSGALMYGKLGEYTYSLRKVRRQLNSKGKIKSEDYQDYEAYPIKGRHALIQLAENGNRLAVTMIDINRKHATEELIKSADNVVNSEQVSVEDEAQKIGYWGASVEGAMQKRGQARRNVFITIDPETFFKACETSSPRSVLLEGRETIVMDFRPRAEVKLKQDQEWIQKLSGTIWVDAAEYSLVRIEGQSAVTADSKNQPLHSPFNFVYQMQRLAPGVWAPSLIRINSAGDENLFRGLNWDAWFEFTNYKRFDTRDSDVKIMNPENKKQ